jgi:hypothetical protein
VQLTHTPSLSLTVELYEDQDYHVFKKKSSPLEEVVGCAIADYCTHSSSSYFGPLVSKCAARGPHNFNVFALATAAPTVIGSGSVGASIMT